MGEQVQQQAGAAVNQAKQQAGQLKEQVLNQATSRLEGQKEQAAGGLGSVAHAIRQSSQHLRDQDQATFADYADRAAEQIEHITGYLSRRDVRQVVGDVEQFSRREPALFLGGAFTLGLLAARFLKSSSRPPQESTSGEYGQSHQYARGVPASALEYGGQPGAERRANMAAAGEHARYGAGGSGTDIGTSQSQEPDVIVGGPPITDVIVGGPPLDPPRAGRSSATGHAGGSPLPGSRSGGDAGA